jgi:hypothetical protein
VNARRAAAGLLLALAFAGAARPAAARQLVTIDRPGMWTLARLGYGDVVLHENERTARSDASVYFGLPPGAAEGPGHWYVFHFHYVVRIRPDAAPGDFNVAAATDDRYTASTIFTVRRRGGRLVTTSDDVGMIAGHVRHASTSLVREIRFENFLAYQGVRPGRNVLRFELSSNSVPLVSSVRIFRDTGIELSRLGPTQVSLALHLDAAAFRVGRPFRLGFTLRRVRGRPLDATTVTALYPADSLRPSGGRSQHLRWGSARPLHGAFDFTPLRAGRIPVELRADAGLHSTKALTAVFVAAAPRTGSSWWIWLLVACVVAAVAGAGLVGLRRRSPGR